eukprot:scaffold63993_cov28-Prasinocladus_malaysianus.AAC.1
MCRSLPQDWDVLYLNACFLEGGEEVGPGVRVFKSGACTLGVVLTLDFALRILHERAVSSHRRSWRWGTYGRRFNDMPFDVLVMTDPASVGSYIADPPL